MEDGQRRKMQLEPKTAIELLMFDSLCVWFWISQSSCKIVVYAAIPTETIRAETINPAPNISRTEMRRDWWR